MDWLPPDCINVLRALAKNPIDDGDLAGLQIQDAQTRIQMLKSKGLADLVRFEDPPKRSWKYTITALGEAYLRDYEVWEQKQSEKDKANRFITKIQIIIGSLTLLFTIWGVLLIILK